MNKFKIKQKTTPPVKSGLSIIEVKKVPMSSIKLWDKNPRKNEKSAKPLAELLKVHGQKSPIVVWIKNNTIYKGNTTYKAAKILKWEYIWVAFTDFPSEKEAIGYALADNKSSEWSDWDESILAMLLPEHMGNNLSEIAGITGFKEADLAGYFAAESNELPDELKEIDILGTSFEDKADYLVVQFPDHKSMDDFKARFNSKTAHPRVITYEMLLGIMEFKDVPAEGVGTNSSGRKTKIQMKVCGKTVMKKKFKLGGK